MSKNIAKQAARVAAKKSAPVKKAASKKAATKKSTARKTVARKTTAKKAAPKKVVRKATVKKAAPKKVVRKATAKKTVRLSVKAAALLDLCQIKGIGPKYAEALYNNRVKSVAMVAKLTKKDIERLSAKLKIGSRMSRENWVAQAKKLAKASKKGGRK